MKKRNPFVDGFTTKDLSCEYCLYYQSRQCQLEVCCCANEKQAALEREGGKAEPSPLRQP